MHRDLKLENIIIQDSDDTEELEIFIVDFGFACYSKDYKKFFPSCGTPGYIAPEVIKGKKYGTNVDIFSVGIILYILLSLQNPFFDGNPENLLQNNMRCKIDFNLPV